MASEKSKTIHIIGAGISGLIAAQVLENHGYAPTIIEVTDSEGGRVKTDTVQGYNLDHGFQVLLTSYPAAQKYLNYKDLNLQYFLPGATIFKNNSISTIGDAFRNLGLLIPTILSTKVSVSDKFKILKLNRILKQKSIEDIFSEKETTTLQYLEKFGFSQTTIQNFFIPFFSGIFLETKLTTSSRMFEFVYKMFGTGYAAIPKAGIGEIPKQLKNNLSATTFVFNTKVTSVGNQTITLSNGETLESDQIIIATNPAKFITSKNSKKIAWKSCQTLYFKTNKSVIKKPIIGLVANEDSLINNIFYSTSLPNTHTGKKQLLSVTVVRNHNLHESLLVKQVTKELETLCGITDVNFLKAYDIAKALPERENLSYAPFSEETKLDNHITLAGDYLCNGSLNAAMLSGELAAKTVIENLENQTIALE